MKPLILLLALSFSAQLSWGQTFAEKKESRNNKHTAKTGLTRLDPGAVSDRAQQQFAQDFQYTSNISWKREAYYDRVSFTNANGSRMDAYYDSNARLIGTTAASSFKEIPSAAQKELSRRYDGCDKAPVLFFDDNSDNDTDMYLYGGHFDDADAYFIQLRNKKGKLEIMKIDLEGKVSRFAGVQS